MLSSPHDSSFILVLCLSRSSRNFDGGAKQRWGLKMSQFSTNNSLSQKRLKIDEYMLRGVWLALNSLSIHVTLTAIVQGRTQGRPKCARNVLKWRTFRLQAWITGTRLKIDGYIQRGVLQALNPISNRVTFTAIVSGATSCGGVKCVGVGKSCDFRPKSLYSSYTVEDRCVHAARRLTSIEFSFNPCNIYRDGPKGVGYPADARSVGDSHPSCNL